MTVLNMSLGLFVRLKSLKNGLTAKTAMSKGISAGKSENSYRSLVRVAQKSDNACSYSQCDSLLLGDKCGAHTFPYMDIHNETAIVEHVAYSGINF